jgi:N-acyl-D-amino-acid deacylase
MESAMKTVLAVCALCLPLILSTACQSGPRYDLIIRNGMILDGSGGDPAGGDIAVDGGRIVSVGALPAGATAEREIDAAGLAVSPGFINMLSWATQSLLIDGRSQSDIRQGVTLEVMGEGWSMGPLNEAMKAEMKANQVDYVFDIPWTTLGEYLEHLEDKGVSCNVASFVGATTVRIHELGYADREATQEEMERMKALVRAAMEEGALGLGSSLIYAPAFYAPTGELIELARAASEHGGIYISHMRSEGNRILDALDELILIAREANIPAEIYHLKLSGRDNWNKLDAVFERIESARAQGLKISADMYTYPAGATGLNAAMPPWVQEGGEKAWIERLKDPAIRRRVEAEMLQPTDEWENFFYMAGPDKMLLSGFNNEALKPLIGRTLADVARERGVSPAQTAFDLLIENGFDVGTIYFLMDEENIRKQIARPWVSFGSDEASLEPEGVFLKNNPHPRAYGNVARLLGKYVREEQVISLQEAVRRLSALPAENLGLADRGRLIPGHWADIVIFDPKTIADHATFEQPHQYATGVRDVFVNGVQVLKDGEHTGATPGVFVRGKVWKRK